MTPKVRNFRELIDWIALTYHGGHYYPIAKRTGLSSALIDQWRYVVVKNPTLPSLKKLCRAYRLNLTFVVGLPPGDPPATSKRAAIGGGSDASMPQDGSPTGRIMLSRRRLLYYGCAWLAHLRATPLAA
jgi:transcriptional regulator with XRE-family HTH domain